MSPMDERTSQPKSRFKSKDWADVLYALGLMSQTRERLMRLPEPELQALLVVLRDELSYEDAARKLGVSVEELHRSLDRARNAIEKMIADRNLH
jgi:DNA-directed RNA polymerase specialized sigma24 family protein